MQVNNQADARGPIPQASQWLAQFRPKATNVGTRASADAASRAGADRGFPHRGNSAGEAISKEIHPSAPAHFAGWDQASVGTVVVLLNFTLLLPSGVLGQRGQA